ncbi:MAG: DUF4350 domain-containing protein, partial [Gemmatimonadales bacterium]
VVVTALLAPEQIAGRTGNARLSTFSTEPQGAQLFSELARRIGWRLQQRKTAEFVPGTANIHAVLDPVMPLRRGEAHALLEQVRQGGALLVVLGAGRDPLGDSLRIGIDSRDFYSRTVSGDASACPALVQSSFVPLWPDNRPHLYGLRWRGPPPAAVETFVDLGGGSRPPGAPAAPRRLSAPQQAVIGFPYGRGRVVVASDPDFLRNDVLRVCSYGLDVRAVRALEYLRDGGDVPRQTIVFDEYHQGYGSQPGTLRTIAGFIGGTTPGHLLFQLLGAGLVLLAAAAPRAIPPRDAERIERRSPLEHVDALARAYAQVGATRTATSRLVRGVRRRVERGTLRGRADASDAAFLQRVEQVAPALAADAGLVRRALDKPVSRHDFEAVGAALERLETSLTKA